MTSENLSVQKARVLAGDFFYFDFNKVNFEIIKRDIK